MIRAGTVPWPTGRGCSKKNRDPLLGWMYHFLKGGETFMDALYDVDDVPRKAPYDRNPVRVFRDYGNIVFKSGWEKDSFAFVMRAGPYINHDHLDQGSFWLADRGSAFIRERGGASYYDSPLYQPRYIQPIAHSTILINGHHQSQRIGDPKIFAEGFEDYAFIDPFLACEHAAFSIGNIGRLYWGTVKSIERNVLYLKPRTLLMIDTIVPTEHDVDVTLLYQPRYQKDIAAGEKYSTITVDGNSLYIMHLAPEQVNVASVETPHYTHTLNRVYPLEKEGMLTVSARTGSTPLVMANLLTITEGVKPDVSTEEGDGYVSGTAAGVPFAFSTRLHSHYTFGDIVTDALAVTVSDSGIFAAVCTELKKGGNLLIRSHEPITCELSTESVKYYLSSKSRISVGVKSRPRAVFLNGERITEFTYQSEQKTIGLDVPDGEGKLTFTVE